MVIRSLPHAEGFKDVAPDALSNQVIYTATSEKYHYPAHSTPYLLVANFKNTGNYQLNKQPVFANDKFFYFLNPGDWLEINFKGGPELETLLIQFSEGFISEWISYRRTPEEKLVDELALNKQDDWYIPNIPFEYSSALRNHLRQISSHGSSEALESHLFDLLESFWPLMEGSHQDLRKTGAKKPATQAELYRRLMIARDFINDHFNRSPTIGQMAAAACLDKFHFLKLYKSRYGITPHQYLVRLKLQHSRELLLTGKYSIFEACSLAGFESQGTFTNLFKRHYGQLPSQVKCNSNSK